MGLFSSGADEAKRVEQQSQASANAYSNLLNSYLSQTRQSMMPYLSGSGQGFDPLQLALMKSSFLNNAAQNYDNANTQVMSALSRRGSAGQGPVGGDYARGIAALQGGQANTVSGGLAGIDTQNLNQALQNKFSALGLMNSSMGQMNNALGSFNQLTGSALNDYIKAKAGGLGGMLSGALGSALGSGLGAGISGGMGSMMSTVGSGNFGW